LKRRMYVLAKIYYVFLISLLMSLIEVFVRPLFLRTPAVTTPAGDITKPIKSTFPITLQSVRSLFDVFTSDAYDTSVWIIVVILGILGFRIIFFRKRRRR